MANHSLPTLRHSTSARSRVKGLIHKDYIDRGRRLNKTDPAVSSAAGHFQLNYLQPITVGGTEAAWVWWVGLVSTFFGQSEQLETKRGQGSGKDNWKKRGWLLGRNGCTIKWKECVKLLFLVFLILNVSKNRRKSSGGRFFPLLWQRGVAFPGSHITWPLAFTTEG